MMRMMQSPRSLATLLATAIAVTLCGSCNEQRNTADRSATPRVSASQLAAAGIPDDELDLGDTWTGSLEPAQRRGAPPRSGARAQARQSAPQSASGSAESAPWSIVLNTFSGEGHAEHARTMMANLGNIAPQLLDRAHIRSTDRGSMVLYSAYPDPDDQRAKRDLEMVKAITFREMQVFPRAFLTRAGAVAQRDDDPLALMTVRQRHPNVNPLYTLQVAAWSDLDSGQMTPDEVRRKAEAYAQELRAKGYEAYFHHEPGSRTSSVTVGLFDRTSYDVREGILDPALHRLFELFPEHLLNGEPALELIDRFNPKKGTHPQAPVLVLVPLK